MIALVFGSVPVVLALEIERAVGQAAEERLFLACPELKVACGIWLVAGERDLWFLVFELIDDLAVRHIAHLVVLFDQLGFLEAHAPSLLRHECIAGLIRLADIAVEPRPALIAFAV